MLKAETKRNSGWSYFLRKLVIFRSASAKCGINNRAHEAPRIDIALALAPLLQFSSLCRSTFFGLWPLFV